MIATSRRRILSTFASAAAIALASLAKAQSVAQADGRSTSEVPPAVDALETFAGTWPFQARYSEAPGFPMHYVDEGTGPDPLAAVSFFTHAATLALRQGGPASAA